MKNIPDYNTIAGQKVNRIEALADGVFAIAMTLLVLDLKVPDHSLVQSEWDNWVELGKLAPKFLSYLLGFLTLGIFWVGHHTLLSFVSKSDRNFTWLNILFLLAISLLPFSTAYLSEHIHYRTAAFLYWLNIFLCGFTIYLNTGYPFRRGLVDQRTVSQNQTQVLHFRVISAQALYFLGFLFCFINTYLGIFLVILIQVNYAFGFVDITALFNRLVGHRK